MSFERPNIRAMAGYVSGEQPEDPRTIKLNTNENPWPPAMCVQTALGQFDVAALRRYPPATAAGLRAQIADLHGLDTDQVIATRGGDELLRLLITTFVEPGQAIGTTLPSYSLYSVLAEIHDSPLCEVALDRDYALPEELARTFNAQGCALNLIVNPHAPSGRLFGADELHDLAAACEGLVLIDEAYVDFVDPASGYDALPILGDLNNVVILRTLSKGYSLAGLRLGYGLGHASVIQPMLRKTRDSYNLDAISQIIAQAALSDQAYARSTWKRLRSERTRLAAQLEELGFFVWPSETNFLLTQLPPDGPSASDVYEYLKAAHILVRYFDSPGMLDKLRITIGTPEENAQLTAALNRLFRNETEQTS